MMGLKGLTIPRDPPPDDVIGAKEKVPHVVLAALPQHWPFLIASSASMGSSQMAWLPMRRAQEKPSWLVKGGFQGTSADTWEGSGAAAAAAAGLVLWC